MIGTRLAHYEITERLGEGGMGVVWKATDTTLGRSVAIKVLPDVLARDPERLARLEREARLLAALSHPNIASIFGLHEDQGVRFLAMELAPGESLAARLQRGAVPSEEALPLALKIAEALEHAHENGIVHRDLKPANVVIGDDGAVKVLDFGLAKAFESDATAASNPSLTQSPTITAGMTQANVILGTAAYMSPEQARGQAADKRADVWSFGVVLFEMLTGARLFEGETVSDTLAAVLRAEPAWDRLPVDTPPRVRTLLARCLNRDRRARLRDIGEARIQLAAEVTGAPDPHLDSLTSGGSLPAGAEAVAGARAGGRWRVVAIGVAAFALGALLGRELPRRGAHIASPIPHRMLGLSAGSEAARPVISPDGARIAWLEGDTVHVQELDSLEPLTIPVRGEPQDLFWAPDGLTLGYVVGSRVVALELRSRSERQVCDTRGAFTGGSGATWGNDGIITLSRAENDGLMQVPEAGGDPKTVVPADSTASDYHDPHALPDGRGVLFVAHSTRGGPDNIFAFDGTGTREVLRLEGHAIADPVYAGSGHILYARSAPNPGIWAVPFSLERLQTTGDPFMVVPDGTAPSVSADGTLLCRPGADLDEADVIRSGADGSSAEAVARVAASVGLFPSISPDGRRIVVGIDDENAVNLWVIDLARGTRTRLTFGEGVENVPSWSPDGRSIVYQARGPGGADWNVLKSGADGSAEPDTLAKGVAPRFTPDGQAVLFTRLPDLMFCAVPAAGGAVREFGISSGTAKAAVSPDGRHVAYVSAETGRAEVFLRRYPEFTGKWQVSAAGGDWPVWNGAGDRLYFAADDDVMSVDVEIGASPRLGAPRRLFTRPHLSARGVVSWFARFSMTPDGQTFVYGIDAETNRSSTSTLLLDQNWLAPFVNRTEP